MLSIDVMVQFQKKCREIVRAMITVGYVYSLALVIRTACVVIRTACVVIRITCVVIRTIRAPLPSESRQF